MFERMRILVTGHLGYVGALLRRDRSSSAVGAPVTYGLPVKLCAKISLDALLKVRRLHCGPGVTTLSRGCSVSGDHAARQA